jgi:hypothetical protein
MQLPTKWLNSLWVICLTIQLLVQGVMGYLRHEFWKNFAGPGNVLVGALFVWAVAYYLFAARKSRQAKGKSDKTHLA